MAASDRDSAPPQPQPALPVVVAAPEAVGGAPMGVDSVLALQRTAGNRAVCRAIASGQIQRDDAVPAAATALTGVSVSPSKATMPLEAGTTITARARPAGATGVAYSLAADTVAPAAGTSIDASTGAVTLDAKQPGGSLKAKATNSAGWADQPFRVIEKPSAIASTSATDASGADYKGHFVHTFSSSGASAAGLDGENINERFDSLAAATPFGPFTLQANAAGSTGWDLDSSGTMAGPDKVSIAKTGIDASTFVKSASNPAPAKSLPQGFSMTQKLHAKSFPSGALDATPFTSTPHVRTLEEKGGKLQVKLSAGTDSVSIDYAGPAVFRNASADKTKVEASPPKPKTGAWKRNEVQVSVDAEPSGAKVKYSIAGEALGCSVDASGKVLIGDKPGTIKVRAGDGGSKFDEVSIEITAPPAAVPAVPKAAGLEPDGGEAVPAAEVGAAPPEQ